MKNLVVLYNSIESVVATIKLVNEAWESGEKLNIVFATADIPCEKVPVESNIYALCDVIAEFAKARMNTVEDLILMDYGDKWFKLTDRAYNAEKTEVMPPCYGCTMYSYVSAIELCKEYDADLVTGECDNLNETNHISCFNRAKGAISYMNEFAENNGVKVIKPLIDSTKDEIMSLYKDFCNQYKLDTDSFLMSTCLIQPEIIQESENSKKFIDVILKPRMIQVIYELCTQNEQNGGI